MQHIFWQPAFLLALLSPVQSARNLRDTSSSSANSGSSNLPSAWATGIATNYGGPSEGKDPSSPSFGTSDGSCGYGMMDKTKYPYWSVAALSPSNPFYVAGPVGACGQCFEVQCVNSGGKYAGRCNADSSQRSVTVMISDVCPECESNHMDIQALTYNKMAPMLGGRIDIQYRRVQCTPPSNLQVIVDKNSGTGGFLKMSVSTAGGSGGISSVQVKGGDGDAGWTGLHNLYGSMWELDSQPQLPLDLHITADSGQELTAFGVIDKDGQTGTLPTGVQFSFSGPPSFDEASSIRSTESSSDSSSSDPSSDAAPSSSGGSSSSSSGGSSSSSSSSGGSSSSSGDSSASASPGGGADASDASAGDSEVSAYDGPTPSSPKASSPSSKDPSPSSSSSSSSPFSKGSSPSSSSSNGACPDVAPGKNSCSQEKAWGHCSSSWMKKASSSSPKGYCAKTCSRC